MTSFAYHYRRRHLDGTTAISTTSGPALMRRDDRTALVVDDLFTSSILHDPVSGRRGAGQDDRWPVV